MELTLPSRVRWLFLDLNSYFASVEQQRRPELRGLPVAVVPVETDATCAIAASYEAKAFGIKTGTKIYEAKRLCPELICVKACHEYYVDFHNKILAEIDRHIPVTHIASIDEVACELDASESNPAAAVALARRIKAGIHANVGEAIHCSIGIAPNRFLAKIATELEKPDGLVVVRPEDIPGKLLSLSFDDIPGLGRAMQYRLYKAGISTMDQLYALPPKQMRALWHNVGGERMYYKLRGVEIPDEPTQRRTVGHSHVISPQHRAPDQARLISQRLMAKAVSRMRREGYAATALLLSARLEQRERIYAELRFAAVKDHVALLKHWDQCWGMLVAPYGNNIPRLHKVSVTLHGLVADGRMQGDLFQQTVEMVEDEDKMADVSVRREQLSQAIDALNKRFGRNTITTATTLGDASSFTGTKIAFTRIPDKAEFKE